MKPFSDSRKFTKLIIPGLLIIFLLSLAGCTMPELDIAQLRGNLTNDSLEVDPPSTEEASNENILVVEEIVIALLFIASLVAIVTKRLRVPYTVGLVLIGLGLSAFGDMDFNFSPNLFLALLVPPLVFEAAFHIKFKRLQRDLIPIVSLAVPGVLLTTFTVGGLLAWATDLPLKYALVFGALIAPSDPVAVVALFRSLGVPKRLQVLIEGESLLNDGTAIVLFNLMIAIAVTGEFSLVNSVLDFFLVSGGGLLVGFILGWIISQAISLINDSLIETTLTSVLAFGAYLIAEQFHVSGVLAVVAAGIVSGNLGPQRMAPSTKILVFSFWEYAAFLANSFIFLLIGLQINLDLLLANWYAILWAILAVLVSRGVGVYGLSWIGGGIPKRFKPVMYWGGLKGAISLALALSLPTALTGFRAEIQALAFGAVLFTLLVQGLSMKPLINWLNLIERSEAQREYENRLARAVMARQAYNQLKSMYQDGYLTKHVWEVLSDPLRQRSESLAEAVTQAMHENPELEAEEMDSAIQEILEAQRGALRDLLRDGNITEHTYSTLVNEVDSALTADQADLVDLLRHKTKEEINTLMTIIVPESEVDEVTALLGGKGFPVTHVASRGGFAGHKNATLLVGAPPERESDVLQLLRQASSERLLDLQGQSGPDDQTIPSGATVFSFQVERYEVI